MLRRRRKWPTPSPSSPPPAPGLTRRSTLPSHSLRPGADAHGPARRQPERGQLLVECTSRPALQAFLGAWRPALGHQVAIATALAPGGGSAGVLRGGFAVARRRGTAEKSSAPYAAAPPGPKPLRMPYSRTSGHRLRADGAELGVSAIPLRQTRAVPAWLDAATSGISEY